MRKYLSWRSSKTVRVGCRRNKHKPFHFLLIKVKFTGENVHRNGRRYHCSRVETKGKACTTSSSIQIMDYGQDYYKGSVRRLIIDWVNRNLIKTELVRSVFGVTDFYILQSVEG